MKSAPNGIDLEHRVKGAQAAADLLGVSVATIRNRMDDRKLAFWKDHEHRTILFDRREIERHAANPAQTSPVYDDVRVKPGDKAFADADVATDRLNEFAKGSARAAGVMLSDEFASMSLAQFRELQAYAARFREVHGLHPDDFFERHKSTPGEIPYLPVEPLRRVDPDDWW